MIIDKKYNGQVVGLSYTKFKIPESNPAEHIRVAKVKVRFAFIDGDLDEILSDSDIANSDTYDNCSWGERVGDYKLNVNGIIIPCKIVNVSRINKSDVEKFFTLTLRTQELEIAASIGNYLKDKENPCEIILSKA